MNNNLESNNIKKERYTKKLVKMQAKSTFTLLIGIVLSANFVMSAEVSYTRENFYTKLKSQKEEIQKRISENEKRIKELKKDHYELVRKADYYAKPRYDWRNNRIFDKKNPYFPSIQWFFPITWEHSGKMKNRTGKEWRQTIEAIKDEYPNKDIQVSDEAAIQMLTKGHDQYRGISAGGNGVVSFSTDNSVIMDIGININEFNVSMPNITKDVQLYLSTPADVSVPDPIIPNVVLPAAPGTVSVPNIVVAVPEAIQISPITDPTVPNITMPSAFDIPEKPSDKVLNTTIRSLYTPTSPTAPIVNIGDIPKMEMFVGSMGLSSITARVTDPVNADNSYKTLNGVPSPLMGGIGVLSGNFIIERNIEPNEVTTVTGTTVSPWANTDNTLKYSHSNYNYFIPSATPVTVTLPSRVNEYVTNITYNTQYLPSLETWGVGFQQMSYYPFLSNATALMTRKDPGALWTIPGTAETTHMTGDYIHIDSHNNLNKSWLDNDTKSGIETFGNDTRVGVNILSMVTDIYTNYKNLPDAGEPYLDTLGGGKGIVIQADNAGLVYANTGEVTLEGQYLNFASIYNHDDASPSAVYLINTGKILIKPYSDGTNIANNNTAGFAIAADTAERYQPIIYNKGIVDIWSNISNGIYINQGSIDCFSGRKYNDLAYPTIVNRNEINMYGNSAVGIYGEGMSKYHADILNTGAISSNSNNLTNNGLVYMDFKEGGNFKGSINMYGDKNIGFYAGEKLYVNNNQYLYFDSGTTGAGNQSMDATGTSFFKDGVTVQYNNSPNPSSATLKGVTTYDYTTNYGIQGNLVVNIGALGIGNQKYTDAGTVNSAPLTNYDPNDDGTPSNSDNIEGSVGLLSYQHMLLTEHQVIVWDKTENCIAVLPVTGSNALVLSSNTIANHSPAAQYTKLYLGDGKIGVTGGTNNIGILADNFTTSSGAYIGGDVFSTGKVELTNGTNNTGIIAGHGNSVSIKEFSSSGDTNVIGIFADGSVTRRENDDTLTTTKVEITDGFSMDNTTLTASTSDTNNIVGVFSTNKAVVDIDRTAPTPTTANIDIKGGHLSDNNSIYRGIALMASDEGVINAAYNNIKVTNGSAGVAATGGGKINMQGSHLTYDGVGYAIYSVGDNGSTEKSKVDISNGTIDLYGEALGLLIKVSAPTDNLVTTGATVNIYSPDAIGVNADNTGNLLTIGSTTNTYTDIPALSGLGLPTINDTTGDAKEILVISGDIDLDTDMDKSNIAVGPSSFFYRKLLNYGVKLTLNSGKTIKAQLTNAEAADFDNNVIGLEEYSYVGAAGRSAYGIDDNDTKIIISSGAKIQADKTDTGAGAIGAFINYGDLLNDGIIEVQKLNDAITGGIGVYASDGSMAKNTGVIDVYGDEGVGIYGVSYRVSASGIEGAEYGNKTAEGTVQITNTNNVTVHGNNAVGIYLQNNTDDSGLTIAEQNKKAEVFNTGTIELKDGVSQVGIFSRGDGVIGDTQVSHTGTLKVGTQNIGIYGTNNTSITAFSGAELGSGSLALLLDDGSAAASSSLTLLNNFTDSDTTGSKAIYGVISSTPGSVDTAPRTVSIDIDGTGLTKGTDLYISERSDVTYAAGKTMKVGNQGIGIYANNTGTGSAINAGTIDLSATLGELGYGMYAKNGNLVNTGTINVNNVSQVGIVLDGTSATMATLSNTGNIMLNESNAIGIYAKGSNANILSIGNIGILTGKTDSTEIVGDNTNIDFTVPTTVVLNNNERTIYIYAINGTKINSSVPLTIDGTATPVLPNTDRSIGFYLNGSTTVPNTFDNSTGTLTVKNGAVGIYSKDNNIIKNGSYIADDNSSIGIFANGEVSLENVSILSKASSGSQSIGVYANDKVNISGTNNKITLGDPSKNGGTGIYLVDNGYLTGNAVTVENLGNITNTGIYYKSSGILTHDTDIMLQGSNTVIGLLVNGGITLTNMKNITDDTASVGIGVAVGGNSTYIQNGNHTNNGNIGSGDSVGIYVMDGNGINNGIIDFTLAQNNSAGIIAKATAGNTALVKNTGTISSAKIAMGIDSSLGTSKGENSGTISTSNGVALFAAGAGSAFDGTSGTIRVTGTGLGAYIKDIPVGNIASFGAFDMSGAGAGSVGIYSDNSYIDHDVIFNGGDIGIYAINNTNITGNVDASNTLDNTAVYLADSSVNINGSTIDVGNASVGKTSIGLFLGGILQNYNILDNISLNVDNENTIGVYVAGGNTYKFNPNTTAHIKRNAVGIVADGTGSTIETQGGTLNVDGAGLGIYLRNGAIGNIGNLGPLNVAFTGTGGVLVFNDNSTLNMGTVNITSGYGTLAATKDGNLSNSGILNITNGSIGLLGVYSSVGVGTVANTSTGIINVGTGSLGMVITGVIGAAPNVVNDGAINVDGALGVGIFANIGNVINTSNIDVQNSGIGMYVTKNASITDAGDITVKKAIGVLTKGVNHVAVSSGKSIKLLDGDPSNYSIGTYYKEPQNSFVSLGKTDDIGDNTIKYVFEGNGPALTQISTNDDVSVGTTGSTNNIGAVLKNIETTFNNTVTVAGDKNIGIYSDNSKVSTDNIIVDTSSYSADKSLSSIGVYGKASEMDIDNIDIGTNSIGILGNDSIINVGAMNIGDNAVGVYSEDTGSGNSKINILNNSTVAKGAVGAYGNNSDITLSALMNVGTDGSTGLFSKGSSNVIINGDISVANKDNAPSLAIYKEGQGIVDIYPGKTLDIGENGAGVFATSNLGMINVNNSGNVILHGGAVGFNGTGNVMLNNNGYISVGPTKNSEIPNVSLHENSVGIYLKNGAAGKNLGTIDVLNSHSVGVYAVGQGTYFENSVGGTINIDNGGYGVLARDHGVVVNLGTIKILSSNKGHNGKESVGMASYEDGQIINKGVIDIQGGYGMYVGTSGILDNQGVINVQEGTGISGMGTVVNRGTINVSPLGSGHDVVVEDNAKIKGSVIIDNAGNVTVNGNYSGIGGTIIATSNVILDGAYFGMESFTEGSVPVITTAQAISGKVKLLPDFATYGNGRHWTIKNYSDYFVAAGATSHITTTSSPMYLINGVNKDLVIYKVNYSDLTVGEQFDNLYNGLDDLIPDDDTKIGTKDWNILTSWNKYLNEVYETSGTDEFSKETSLGLAETRGDIYSTIQKRMQNIEHAYDNSFEEMIDSYNYTKETDKYSIIYTKGDYNDDTLGIDDYDYNIYGLMYMREIEGRDYNNKKGYTLGFTVSKFKFDDSYKYDVKSKEDVYSLRAGMHNVHSFLSDGADKTRLITRLELGYNRHEAKRSIELDKLYRNKGHYNTYMVSFDNKLAHNLTRGYKHNIDVYVAFNCEYGIIDGFTEKGDGLHLKVKDNNYLSMQPEIGLQGDRRFKTGRYHSIKLYGNAAYAYELGDNYDNNRARVADGNNGYYDLIEPEKERGILRGKIGISFERANHYGVSLEFEGAKHQNKKDIDRHYSLRFNYKY